MTTMTITQLWMFTIHEHTYPLYLCLLDDLHFRNSRSDITASTGVTPKSPGVLCVYRKRINVGSKPTHKWLYYAANHIYVTLQSKLRALHNQPRT